MRGRPTDYKPEFCEQVIELGRQGKSKAQMAAALGVVRQTLENWCRDHLDFLDAMTRARDLSQSWWEDVGQQNLNADRFQASLWARSMSARFPDDYSDRIRNEITNPDGSLANVNETQLATKLAAIQQAALRRKQEAEDGNPGSDLV